MENFDEDNFESMDVTDLNIPSNCVVIILGGDRDSSLAFLGDPGPEDRSRAESIYRLLTATATSPKNMEKAVTRGLAMINETLH